jgi:hypothetical protein
MITDNVVMEGSCLFQDHRDDTADSDQWRKNWGRADDVDSAPRGRRYPLSPAALRRHLPVIGFARFDVRRRARIVEVSMQVTV